jgi:hypothetical protein
MMLIQCVATELWNYKTYYRGIQNEHDPDLQYTLALLLQKARGLFV